MDGAWLVAGFWVQIDYTPRKLTWQWKNNHLIPFEDVSPIKNCDFPLTCFTFREGTVMVFVISRPFYTVLFWHFLPSSWEWKNVKMALVKPLPWLLEDDYLLRTCHPLKKMKVFNLVQNGYGTVQSSTHPQCSASRFFSQYQIYTHIYPWGLTWNLPISPWSHYFRGNHVENFGGCKWNARNSFSVFFHLLVLPMMLLRSSMTLLHLATYIRTQRWIWGCFRKIRWHVTTLHAFWFLYI